MMTLNLDLLECQLPNLRVGSKDDWPIFETMRRRFRYLGGSYYILTTSVSTKWKQSFFSHEDVGSAGELFFLKALTTANRA
jgi:hypothetical protein